MLLASRLAQVPVRAAVSGAFPLVELLQACTTLDRAQAEALKAGLLQEWSLIQGPPGTGALASCKQCLLKAGLSTLRGSGMSTSQLLADTLALPTVTACYCQYSNCLPLAVQCLPVCLHSL